MIRRKAEARLITTLSRKLTVGNCRYIVLAEFSHTDRRPNYTLNTTTRNASSQHLTPIQIFSRNPPVHLSLKHTSTITQSRHHHHQQLKLPTTSVAFASRVTRHQRHLPTLLGSSKSYSSFGPGWTQPSGFRPTIK